MTYHRCSSLKLKVAFFIARAQDVLPKTEPNDHTATTIVEKNATHSTDNTPIEMANSLIHSTLLFLFKKKGSHPSVLFRQKNLDYGIHGTQHDTGASLLVIAAALRKTEPRRFRGAFTKRRKKKKKKKKLVATTRNNTALRFMLSFRDVSFASVHVANSSHTTIRKAAVPHLPRGSAGSRFLGVIRVPR